jgi:hypothetical protein
MPAQWPGIGPSKGSPNMLGRSSLVFRSWSRSVDIHSTVWSLRRPLRSFSVL